MFGYFEQKANELWKVVAPEASEIDQWFSIVKQGDLGAISQSIQQGSQVDARDSKGNTALHIAALHGLGDVVNFLIDNGADVYATGESGNSVIHFAAMSGNMDLVNVLLGIGLKASAKNGYNQSAYDVAKGFAVKQSLMQIVLKEENESGDSSIAENLMILGASRDLKKDEERLKNIGPPPSGAATGAPTYNYGQYRKPNGRAPNRVIKENDGFVTTVGNPELSAKYGNVTSYTHFEAEQNAIPQDATSVMPQQAPLESNQSRPVSRARPAYVPFPHATAAPTASENSSPQPRASIQPVSIKPNKRVNVFNPAVRK